jgi:uncharacterized protein (TIGR03790 family)
LRFAAGRTSIGEYERDRISSDRQERGLIPRTIFGLLALGGVLQAQTAANVLLVVNKQSFLSRRIGQHYIRQREIPLTQVVTLDTPPNESIARAVYTKDVEAPIYAFLVKNNLADRIYYIVTTLGVPLKIEGTEDAMNAEHASVDSELAALYGRKHGLDWPLKGAIRNPFYGQRDGAFRHPNFPMYLVTRLAGYDFDDVRAMIDRGLAAKNTGMFVIDLKDGDPTPGNGWLRAAATLLPKDRVILDETAKVLYNQKNVIGFASWGSNDYERKERHLHFEWLPGAIAIEYVSTNARTFARPPETWNLGNWKDVNTWFAGSPQTMIADLVHEGVSGIAGHVYEPYLGLNPRPDLLLPAYFSGRNLAESYYLSMPGISWQGVVVGDPLCRLK